MEQTFSRDDFLEHYGIKGMKWGVRRYQNEDGTLTDAGEKRYSRDVSENNARKKENRITIDKPDANRWVKEDLRRGKRALDEASSLVNKASEIERKSSPKPKKIKMDLSKMSDKELRDAINRRQLERQYNDLFSQLEDAKVSKGRKAVREILEIAGTTIGVGTSIVSLALAIKELKG